MLPCPPAMACSCTIHCCVCQQAMSLPVRHLQGFRQPAPTVGRHGGAGSAHSSEQQVCHTSCTLPRQSHSPGLSFRSSCVEGGVRPLHEKAAGCLPPSCLVCSLQCTDREFSCLCTACFEAGGRASHFKLRAPPFLVQSDRAAAAVLGQHGIAAAAESVLQWPQWACPCLLDQPAQPLCHVSVSLPAC